MPGRPGLTIAMIVRDERENLVELLPRITMVADDVVIVDTGSVDDTPDVAEEAGARVFHQEWADDFSRARNRGLEEVATSHVMWLDADERIDPADLALVRKTVLDRGPLGLLLRIVAESANPLFAASRDQLRVFPARPEHRFVRRVHERIRPALEKTGTPIDHLDATILHTGYASEDDVLRKSRRNLALSRMEREEGERGISSTYHYVRAASIVGRIDEAAGVAREYLADPPRDAPPDMLQNLRIALGHLEWRRGLPPVAEEIYRDAVERVPDDPFARYHLGDFLLGTGRTREAVEQLETARESPLHGSRVPMPELALRKAIRVRLAEAYEAGGERLAAANTYREALQIDPRDAMLRERLTRALVAFAQGELETTS
jgi:hypothetical protein